MAPTRRKGGKAAAAAAARRQWKVGDLVLAKVKGFPAWPATVSEPEKWGYPPDWKKVLVYFFGTQQIAFCNPADVEAFTEEKKQSLLVKRQGKGADFVRALQEIIDSYEKLKRQNQLDEFNSGEEVVRTNGGNSSESLAQFEAKDQAETSEATVMGRNEPRLLTGDAPTEGLDASLDEKETLAEQCNDGIIVTGKTVLATYTSRKRSAGSRPRKRVTQKKTLSAERPGNSAVVDSSRFQNFLLSSDEGNKTSGDASSNLTRSASLRRNKRIRKSPNVSDWEDVDSSTFIPNGSVEDDGSEIATVESDSFSLNEGSGVDSGCKLEHSDTFVECLEEDVQLSKAVVIKKKRKLNRKPSDNETAEPAARQEAMVDLELRVHNSSQDSQTACENSSERYNREDGDEHLPLVKRARVRMSKSSFMEEDHNMSSQAGGKLSNEVAGNLMEENNSFCQAEDRNSDEAVAGILEQMASSANRSHGFSADRDSAIVNVALDIASSPKDCAEILENQVQLSRVEENQSVCCSADEEAALPPSKRLHRALEAMSANVAEECNEVSETLSAKAANSDVSPASMAIPSDMDDKSKVSHSSQDNCLPSNVNVVSVFSFSSNAALVERTTCIQSIESPKRKEHEKTLWVNAGHKDDGKDPSGSCFDGPAISSGDAKAPNPVDLTPTLDRSMTAEQCEPGSSDCLVLKNECSSENLGVSVSRAENPNEVPAISSEYAKAPNPVDLTPTPHRSMAAEQCEPGSSDCLVLKNECSSENIGVSVSRAENPDEELDILEHSGKSPEHHILEQLEAQAASQNGVEVVSFGTDNTGKSQEHNNAVCETTESWRSQIDENNQANDKIEVVEEVKQGLRQNEAVSVSSSEDLVGDRDTLSLRSSPAEAEAAAQTWPPTVCHVSTEESTNGNQSCSSLSPNTLLCRKRTLNDDVKAEFIAPQRPKSVGKGSNSAEVYASLSSFEGMLVSLTRTKESIGRATRMAIDCAKLGVSAKVVEILVRTLENESSLHRRVDLFFLVDSITQCSRGLKSDVGGVYPPAIQAVLPRLLASAAPPGNFATDNRRQCMKVLRLWLDRRVLPESIVRHHMRELDMLNASSSAGPYARRSARTERALDDPIRDMEGMQVDEYGSNSSFQLPGFCMPRMLKDEDEDEDEGSDSDGESFEAVTPEHNPEFLGEREIVSAAEKHTHILEEVDGELEMEDVAPSCVIEMNSTSCATGVTGPQGSHEQFEECSADHFAPPPLPPSSPPLPSSPPPPPPPPPPLATGPHPCSIQDDARQPLAQQSAAPRIDPSLHNTAHYPPKCRDQLQMQHCDSTNSFGNYPVHSTDNAQYNDGPSFHHKTYPPRPPHPPPSNHFSYVPPGQHVKSRRETPPPPYSHRFHSSRDADGGNFYSNHERMRPGPYESNDGWRYPPPQFPGPRYHDKPKASFEHVPYGSGPPREPGRHHHHGWGYPRGMHNRNFMPFRPPSEGAVPVSNRASSGWRPS